MRSHETLITKILGDSHQFRENLARLARFRENPREGRKRQFRRAKLRFRPENASFAERNCIFGLRNWVFGRRRRFSEPQMGATTPSEAFAEFLAVSSASCTHGIKDPCVQEALAPSIGRTSWEKPERAFVSPFKRFPKFAARSRALMLRSMSARENV